MGFEMASAFTEDEDTDVIVAPTVLLNKRLMGSSRGTNFGGIGAGSDDDD